VHYTNSIQEVMDLFLSQLQCMCESTEWSRDAHCTHIYSRV